MIHGTLNIHVLMNTSEISCMADQMRRSFGLMCLHKMTTSKMAISIAAVEWPENNMMPILKP